MRVLSHSLAEIESAFKFRTVNLELNSELNSATSGISNSKRKKSWKENMTNLIRINEPVLQCKQVCDSMASSSAGRQRIRLKARTKHQGHLLIGAKRISLTSWPFVRRHCHSMAVCRTMCPTYIEQQHPLLFTSESKWEGEFEWIAEREFRCRIDELQFDSLVNS